MPWLEDRRRRNMGSTGGGTYNLPPGRMEAAIADGERIAAGPSRNRQKQLRAAIDTVNKAQRDAITALVEAERMGFELPTAAALVEEHGKALPAFARSELRGLLDEVRPVIASGDRGRPREAGRRFAWEVGEAMVDEGWAPKEPTMAELEANDPAKLAALVPRS